MVALCFSALFVFVLTVVHGTECSTGFTATGIEKDSSSSRIVLRFWNVQFNGGNSYSPKTGKFICRIPGVYSFSVTLSRERNKSGNVHAYLTINDRHKLTLFSQIKGAYPLSATGTFHLNQNDEVYVEGNPSYFSSGTYSFFTGYLVSAD